MASTEQSPQEQNRPSWDEYPLWLTDVDPPSAGVQGSKGRYETIGAKIRADVASSDAWRSIVADMREFHDEYTIATTYPLLASLDEPQLHLKPYSSILEKTYRKNVLNNSEWPKSPKEGWITPSNWYSLINDIVRTTIVVKYLDGVQFLVERLQRIAEEKGNRFKADYEARDEGYYAAHCYVWFNLEVPRVDWNTEIVPVRFEIQVTTQVQEVIRKLTHDYYERRRLRLTPRETKWQWEYESPEFLPNYLGHVLHYVEGMIMEVSKRGSSA